MPSPKVDPRAVLEVERGLARTNFRFFAIEVLGLDFVEHVHGDIMDALQAGDWDEILIMLPRDCFKSSLVAAYIAWRVVQDRNFRCLIVGITYTKTVEVGNLSRQYLMKEKVVEIFGSFEGDVKWSSEQFLVSGRTRELREPTVTVMGRDSFTPGGHYDLVWFDDPDNRETVSTPEQIAKTRSVDSDSYPMCSEPGAKRGTTGTFWDDLDLYNYKIDRYRLYEEHEDEGKIVRVKPPMLRRNREFTRSDGSVYNRRLISFHKPAAKPDLTDLLFPERLSEDYLLAKKDEMTASDFSAQYLLDPVSRENASFLPADFVYEAKAPTTGRCHIGLDVARSREKSADYIGMVIADVDVDLNFYVHETLRFQMDSRQLWDRIIEKHLKYTRGNQPPTFAIEEDHYVAGWKRYFLDHCRSLGLILRIEWIPSFSRASKPLRIEALQPLFRGGKVKIAPGQTVLEEELVRFPGGRYRDVADSFSNIYEIARKAQKAKPEPTKWGNFVLRKSPLQEKAGSGGLRDPRKVTTEAGMALKY